MAELIGNIPWIGTLGTLNAYKRKDSDKTILRGKRRPLSEAERNSDKYLLTRLASNEFGGRSRASSSIMTALIELRNLADYNVAGPINAILRPIQVADQVNENGKRSIMLSKHTHLLQGFNFNRKPTFDSVIRSQIGFSIDRENLNARITIPELIKDINLFIPNRHPLFGFSVTLGLVPDFVFKDGAYQAVNGEGHRDPSRQTVDTEWFPSSIGSKEINLEIKLTKPNLPSSFTLILGVGIRYGTVGEGAVLQRVTYAGCAKIIGALGVS
jgi:hypothetical protein